jgi:hypothetical protein
VIVEGARCVKYVGDGWQVRYRVSNSGPADTGSVVGQVDDSPPVVLEPARVLAQGDSFTEEALLPGGGDAIVVTWVARSGGASFRKLVSNGRCGTGPVPRWAILAPVVQISVVARTEDDLEVPA